MAGNMRRVSAKPGDDPVAVKIANEFVDTLRAWFTRKEWAEMLKRNRAEDDPNVCHSHDFCDANMAMEPAFKKYTGRSIDAGSDADAKLWSVAWKLAVRDVIGGKVEEGVEGS